MPKKLSIQDVQDYITENDVNNECTLLSTEYKNSTTPLSLLCNRCGQVFTRDWAHLKRGRFSCTPCANKKPTRTNITIQDVRDFIEGNDANKDCLLLSEEYVNSATPLQLKCNICGQKFERDFAHIKRGRFRCAQCGIVAGAKRLVYSENEVDEIIAEKGYTRTGAYVNASTPFEVKCKRGHVTTLSFSHFLVGHSGCKQCANLERTGELSPNWQGGASEVIDQLRKSITEWKYKVFARDNYTCQITKSKKDLIVHHIISFCDLVKQASEETGIPVLRKISEYDNTDDFYRLEQRVRELHLIENGITMTRQIHDEFHKIYGKGNNNREQLEEFLSKHG